MSQDYKILLPVKTLIIVRCILSSQHRSKKDDDVVTFLRLEIFLVNCYPVEYVWMKVLL